MRKIFLIALLFAFAGFGVSAQDSEIQLKKEIKDLETQVGALNKETNAKKAQLEALMTRGWRTGGLSTILVSNVSYNDTWKEVSGNNNNLNIEGNLNLFGNYADDQWIWENGARFTLGFNKNGGVTFQDTANPGETFNNWLKGADEINLYSKFGYKFSEKVRLSLLANFRSQFAKGFYYGADGNGDGILDNQYITRPNCDTGVADTLQTIKPYGTDGNTDYISKFLAPAYLEIGPGIDWAAAPGFTVFFSPATYKLTIVNDDFLSSYGAFGVDVGEKTRSEVGAKLMAGYNRKLMSNLTVTSTLEAFANYTDPSQDQNCEDVDFMKNIDVLWNTVFGLTVNKYITASLDFTVKRDVDQTYPLYSVLGDEHWQVSNLVKVGFAYQF